MVLSHSVSSLESIDYYDFVIYVCIATVPLDLKRTVSLNKRIAWNDHAKTFDDIGQYSEAADCDN